MFLVSHSVLSDSLWPLDSSPPGPSVHGLPRSFAGNPSRQCSCPLASCLAPCALKGAWSVLSGHGGEESFPVLGGWENQMGNAAKGGGISSRAFQNYCVIAVWWGAAPWQWGLVLCCHLVLCCPGLDPVPGPVWIQAQRHPPLPHIFCLSPKWGSDPPSISRISVDRNHVGLFSFPWTFCFAEM